MQLWMYQLFMKHIATHSSSIVTCELKFLIERQTGKMFFLGLSIVLKHNEFYQMKDSKINVLKLNIFLIRTIKRFKRIHGIM